MFDRKSFLRRLNDNAFLFKIWIKRFFAKFSSNSTLSESSKRSRSFPRGPIINKNLSWFHFIYNFQSRIKVLSNYSWYEPVFTFVRSFNYFVNAFEFKNAHNRSKNFFFCYRHMVLYIRKYCCFHKISLSINSFSSALKYCSFLNSHVYKW